MTFLPTTVGGWAALVLALIALGGGTLFLTMADTAGIATKSYHDNDVKEQQKVVLDAVASLQMEMAPIVDDSLINRVLRLRKLRCRSPESWSQDLEGLLSREEGKYETRNKRPFTEGTCDAEGRYCNALGVCEF